MKCALSSFILLLFSLPAFASGGGWSSAGAPAFAGGGGWSSSGGSGVACFSSPKEAEEAEPYIQRGELVPDALLARAKLNLLEHWELNATDQEVATFDKNASFSDIFSKTLRTVDYSFPLFALRLHDAVNLVDFSKWEETSKPEMIEDAHPIAPLPDNCRRIQIVVRLSKGDHIRGQGPTEKTPEVRVRYARKYFDLLPPVDQAMLLMHESLYVLGKATGHEASDIIRGFTRILFLKSWHESRYHLPPYITDPTTLEVKFKLIDSLGDYIYYFSEDRKPEDGPLYTPKHHFFVFFKMITRLRARMDQCLAQGFKPPVCKEKTMNPFVLKDDLSREEAFLYLADFALEQSIKGFNADYVMVPTGEDPRIFQRAMEYACDRISSFKSQMPFVSQGIAYCTDWKAHYSVQENKSN